MTETAATLEELTLNVEQSIEILAVPEKAFAAMLERLGPEIMSSDRAPRTVDWLRRMEARPAVQAALAMPNKVAETLQAVAG